MDKTPSTRNRLADRAWREQVAARDHAYTLASTAIKAGGLEAGRAFYRAYASNRRAVEGLALALLAQGFKAEAVKCAASVGFDLGPTS